MTAGSLSQALVALGLGAFSLAPASVAPAAASEPSLASPWAIEPATRARLIAGTVTEPGKPARVVAGVEIQLDEAWKTYWRNPGSSGVPPRLEWTGSENLADAVVMYPAPTRFPDRDGVTIGYKSAVILPLEVKPVNPALPVKLKLSLEYGVCKDVCIPVQPLLELTLPADPAKAGAAPGLAAAVDRVPRAPGARATDPRLSRVAIDLQSAKPHVQMQIAIAGDGRGADVFLEAPDGLWIPLPVPATVGQKGADQTFLVDLTDGADIGDLKGREIRVTIISEAGATDTSFKLE